MILQNRVLRQLITSDASNAIRKSSVALTAAQLAILETLKKMQLFQLPTDRTSLHGILAAGATRKGSLMAGWSQRSSIMTAVSNAIQKVLPEQLWSLRITREERQIHVRDAINRQECRYDKQERYS
jgi:hypothetical protein